MNRNLSLIVGLLGGAVIATLMKINKDIKVLEYLVVTDGKTLYSLYDDVDELRDQFKID